MLRIRIFRHFVSPRSGFSEVASSASKYAADKSSFNLPIRDVPRSRRAIIDVNPAEIATVIKAAAIAKPHSLETLRISAVATIDEIRLATTPNAVVTMDAYTFPREVAELDCCFLLSIHSLPKYLAHTVWLHRRAAAGGAPVEPVLVAVWSFTEGLRKG